MGLAHGRVLRDTPDPDCTRHHEEGNPSMAQTASPPAKPLARRLTSALLLAFCAGAAGPVLADDLDRIAPVVNAEAFGDSAGPKIQLRTF